MPSLNHIHTYRRVRATQDGKHFLYMCTDPHCTFRSPKIFLVGKAALCNSCHNEFVLTSEDLRRAKPVCPNCSQTKDAKEFRRLREALRETFNESEVTS